MKIISLANHFPSRDPRVVWSSLSLSKKGNLTVLGKEEKGYSRADFDYVNIDLILADTSQKLSFAILQSGLSFFISFSLSGILISSVFFVAFSLFFVFRKLAYIVRKFPKLRLILKATWLEKKAFEVYSATSYLIGFFKYTIYGLSKIKQVPIDKDTKYLVNDLDTLLLSVLLKKKHGGYIVYDMHEFWPYQYKERLDLVYYYEKFLIRYVDNFITVSTPLLQFIKKEYGIRKEFFMIPNCSPLEIDHVSDPSHRLNTDETIFLFQGSFSSERGLEFMLNCWVEMPKELNLVLWIRGPFGEYRNGLITLAKSLGIHNKSVFFKDSVKESELIMKASEAHVGVIPYEPVSINNKYCCPNKLSQYMQAGLAILHNDLEFINDMVAKANCGKMYSSKSKKSFIDAVRFLAENRKRLAEYSRNGQKFVMEEYSWEQYEHYLYKAFNLPE